MNDAVQQRGPNVPNQCTILSQVPPERKWFSVVNLSYAFFMQFCESPTIYNDMLKESLSSLKLSPGSALLQYIDDLMICAPTQAQCETDTIALLKLG